MKSLREWQENIQKYIFTEVNDLADAMESSPDLSAEERIEIYRQAYFARLINTLANDYPTLRQWMGEDPFAAMIRDYLVAFPPSDINIHAAGARLPQFLEERLGPSFFSELAQFEWHFSDAVFAPNVAPFTLQKLAAIPQTQWPDMVLRFHPSVRLMDANYNILTCWERLIERGTDAEIEQYPEPVVLVIWRNNQEPFCAQLTEHEALLFRSIQQSLPFAALCEQMQTCFSDDEVVAWVAERLQYWIQQGLFQ